MVERAQITITGIVQGVGFRPYVYSLAVGLGIRGHVTNTAEGVLIEAEGDRLPEFLDRLPKDAPPLSRIADISVRTLPADGLPAFTILPSRDSEQAFTLLSPDVSICPDCLREMQDPADHRYRYPFINCTNCGPRYTITERIPYDRPNTTMAPFVMCAACEREYLDPANRRFHAQPNACPVCGPDIEFRPAGAEHGVTGVAALDTCIDALRQGRIVAVKGLGGFHIACDASNNDAVRRLRERKRKSNKPFAVMVASAEDARAFCELSGHEQIQLESRQRPIVLLGKNRASDRILSDAIAPRNNYIGCMLPYTPLHYLLFETTTFPAFRALVMTSGNLSEEPIVRDNDEAMSKLSGLVDDFLLHNRNIFTRVDDSVVRVIRDGGGIKRAEAAASPAACLSSLFFIRRSRGYAPEPITLPDEGPEVMGCGADLKNTFTLMKGAYAIPSQHIGDMENYETLRFYEETLANLKQVYRVEPEALAHDLHPGYLSTNWALQQPDLLTVGIQHHYAHIGSVMAEHGLKGPVIGVSFDGTGYGTDGNLWGGEFLITDTDGFERVGQIKYMPLPGGEAAIREPWRTAAGLIAELYGLKSDDVLRKIGFTPKYGAQALMQTIRISGIRELSPLSSGAGRLFDAVAAMIGLCDRNTFEGEAAIALESVVREGFEDSYPIVVKQESRYSVIDPSETIRSIVADVLAGCDHAVISTKFHNTLSIVIADVVRNIRQRTGIADVALSGGVFQNSYLALRTQGLLERESMKVFVNRVMPPNDACISLGQAYIVRERLKKHRGTNSGQER